LGVWDDGLFDEDIAADVRATFENAWATGKLVPDITRDILTEYEGALDDTDDGPQIILALAVLQLEHDVLQSDIRDRALAVIHNDEGIERWAVAGAETLVGRRQVLALLQARFISGSM